MSPIRREMLSRYPKDWRLRSRFVRLVRARNRCEWCGAENRQPHPITGSKVCLTTAHVFDHRPEAASLLNLAALCQRCHNRHDAARRKSEHGGRRRVKIERTQIAMWDGFFDGGDVNRYHAAWHRLYAPLPWLVFGEPKA